MLRNNLFAVPVADAHAVVSPSRTRVLPRALRAATVLPPGPTRIIQLHGPKFGSCLLGYCRD